MINDERNIYAGTKTVSVHNHLWPRGAAAISLGFHIGFGFTTGVATVVFIGALINAALGWLT